MHISLIFEVELTTNCTLILKGNKNIKAYGGSYAYKSHVSYTTEVIVLNSGIGVHNCMLVSRNKNKKKQFKGIGFLYDSAELLCF